MVRNDNKLQIKAIQYSRSSSKSTFLSKKQMINSKQINSFSYLNSLQDLTTTQKETQQQWPLPILFPAVFANRSWDLDHVDVEESWTVTVWRILLLVTLGELWFDRVLRRGKGGMALLLYIPVYIKKYHVKVKYSKLCLNDSGRYHEVGCVYWIRLYKVLRIILRNEIESKQIF